VNLNQRSITPQLEIYLEDLKMIPGFGRAGFGRDEMKTQMDADT
jgi:RNA-binding protein YlmH